MSTIGSTPPGHRPYDSDVRKRAAAPEPTDERCGICRPTHMRADHMVGGTGGCEFCMCQKFIAWTHLLKNRPDLQPSELPEEKKKQIDDLRLGNLRRQLGAILDSGLLLAQLMDAMAGDPMIQSRVVDRLILLGLVVQGPNPVSATQPKGST